ncbi:hypothetical protein TGVAND_310300A [Toxoplasma gondii VAND]|uniref:Uncharacterized protein n=1 Tax=Toxoplasma gondii VAND TaxID=933077 RepID=A0A086PPY3_TOXGO|nr:hypothetical protein TGVAND_310300A [Toxoplasma gondii VAND]
MQTREMKKERTAKGERGDLNSFPRRSCSIPFRCDCVEREKDKKRRASRNMWEAKAPCGKIYAFKFLSRYGVFFLTKLSQCSRAARCFDKGRDSPLFFLPRPLASLFPLVSPVRR